MENFASDVPTDNTAQSTKKQSVDSFCVPTLSLFNTALSLACRYSIVMVKHSRFINGDRPCN
jgi:hypothetical protein